MRLMSFTLRLLILLAVFTVWQGKAAFAHEGMGQKNYQSYSSRTDEGQVTPQDKSSQSQKFSLSAEKENTRDCDGSCCGTMNCCVSAVASSELIILGPLLKTGRVRPASYNTPPPGPGYPLLRPPRFSA